MCRAATVTDPGTTRRIRYRATPRLYSVMIIWVGERFKPLLARRAIVLKNEMITWVCGTVGLLRAFE